MMKVVASFFPSADRCYGDVRYLIREQDGGCVVTLVTIVLFIGVGVFLKTASVMLRLQPVV